MTSIISAIVLFVLVNISSSSGVPDSCSSYASISDPNGSMCRAIINGCQTCNLNAYPKTCSLCLPGYYKQQNTCKSCFEKFGKNVQTCIEGELLSCAPSYFLTNGQCQPCPSGCKTCSNPSTCSSCVDGYAYSAGSSSCLACDSSASGLGCCSTDPQTNQCVSCMPNYFLRTSDMKCVSCFSNCKVCSNNLTCSQCVNGYYYDSTNATCVQNPSNCKTVCNEVTPGAVHCTQCEKNYYADASGVCKACAIDNCDECGSPNTCTKCADSYLRIPYTNPSSGISQEKCYPCDTNCDRCHLIDSRKVCYECQNKSTPNSVTQSCVSGISISINDSTDKTTYLNNHAFQFSFDLFSFLFIQFTFFLIK